MLKVKAIIGVVAALWSIAVFVRLFPVLFIEGNTNDVGRQWGWFILVSLLVGGNGILIVMFYIIQIVKKKLKRN
jgi:hypothetical protein